MVEWPWEVSDELWAQVEPLLPQPERAFGRPRLSDRAALEGILFVLATGVPWNALSPQFGYGSGVTCWRRLESWTQAGVWGELHALLLRSLHGADRIDWSRASIRESAIPARKGARKRARARSTAGR